MGVVARLWIFVMNMVFLICFFLCSFLLSDTLFLDRYSYHSIFFLFYVDSISFLCLIANLCWWNLYSNMYDIWCFVYSLCYMIRYIVAFCSLIVIICAGTISLFEDTSFFDQQFTLLGSYQRQPEALDEAKKLMTYWFDGSASIDSPVYTQAEKAHLGDVKRIIGGIVVLTLFCLGVVLVAWWYHRSWLWWRNVFGFSLLFFVSIFGLLFLLSFLDFDTLFTRFHEVFFAWNWSFPADSFLIQSYPEDFFYHAFVTIIVRSGVTILIIRFAIMARLKFLHE